MPAAVLTGMAGAHALQNGGIEQQNYNHNLADLADFGGIWPFHKFQILAVFLQSMSESATTTQAEIDAIKTELGRIRDLVEASMRGRRRAKKTEDADPAAEPAPKRRGRPPKTATEAAEPAPKRRGRPPKNPDEPPKRRGRPPKNPDEPPKRRGRPPKAATEAAEPAPKRRGRPPKNPDEPPKRRGRPRKNQA